MNKENLKLDERIDELKKEIKVKEQEILEIRDNMSAIARAAAYEDLGRELILCRSAFIKAGFKEKEATDLVGALLGNFEFVTAALFADSIPQNNYSKSRHRYSEYRDSSYKTK